MADAMLLLACAASSAHNDAERCFSDTFSTASLAHAKVRGVMLN